MQQAIGLISGPLLKEGVGSGLLLGTGILLLIISTAAMIIVNSYAVKAFYKEKTRKAFMVGVVWSIVTWIISLILGAMVVGIVIALTLGSGAPLQVA